LTEYTGLTALHIAIKSRRVDNAQILLEHGADVHIKTPNGYTAMEMALNLPDTDDPYPENQRNIKKDMIELLQQYDHETPPIVSCLIPRLFGMLTQWLC
jgi:ankyrin repeat protein